MSSLQPSPLYIFLDEGGNFDFSVGGTKYLTITAVVKNRPFSIHEDLASLKYDLYEEGRGQEYFHATEDLQSIRDRVFGRIASKLDRIKIHSIIVEKRKTGPALQPVESLYPKMLFTLLKYILNPDHQAPEKVVVIIDDVPVKRKRDAIEKGVKQYLSHAVPRLGDYQVHHHASKSCFGLQIADYCNWAIYRKWTNGDMRSYDLIKSAIRSEFDVFRTGTRLYY